MRRLYDGKFNYVFSAMKSSDQCQGWGRYGENLCSKRRIFQRSLRLLVAKEFATIKGII